MQTQTKPWNDNIYRGMYPAMPKPSGAWPRPAMLPGVRPTWGLAWGLFWRWMVMAILAYVVVGGIILLVLLMLGWTLESLI